jgi:hypothetical protein
MPVWRDAPLWSCPKCGARLVTRNMSHACGPFTVEGFLADKPPRARALFEAFVALLERCGPVTPAPAKTRVAFMVRVRFGAVDSLTARSLTGHFGLPYRVDNPRILRVDHYAPSWYVHKFRITDLAELDDELSAWLCESYRMMGEQRRFTQPAPGPR